MKFAYSSNLFKPRPLLEAVENIAKAGFQAIELIGDRPHAFPADLTAVEITSLNQALEQHKITACNLNSSWMTVVDEPDNPSWIEEDWKRREKRIRHTLDCLRLAAAVGIPHVSTIGGGPIPPTMNWNDGFRLFVANLHRVLPLATKLGVKLLVQPQPDMLIQTTEHALALLKELEFNEFLKINFDVAHFFCISDDPREAWTKLKNHVAHVHLDDAPADRAYRHLQLGEGVVDIPGFLTCLNESGYEGYVSITVDTYDHMVDEVVMKSADYLRSHGFLE